MSVGVYIYHICDCLRRLEKGVGSPGTGSSQQLCAGKLTHVFWGSKKVLLVAKSSLQLQELLYLWRMCLCMCVCAHTRVQAHSQVLFKASKYSYPPSHVPRSSQQLLLFQELPSARQVPPPQSWPKPDIRFWTIRRDEDGHVAFTLGLDLSHLSWGQTV